MFRDSSYFINYMDGVMSELNVLKLLDDAITAVRDTEYHTVEYVEDGCDGDATGVLYDDVEASVHEVAEDIQCKFDKLTEDNKRLREALEWAEDYTPHSGNQELNPATKALAQTEEA